MIAEAEAKTKFCFRSPEFAGSKQIANGDPGRCLGSACMAWRYVNPEARQDDALINEREHGRRLGYCGLAGRPE